MRTRHPALKGIPQSDVDAIVGWIGSLDGMQSVVVNPRTGSLLLMWDTAALSTDEVADMLSGAAEMLLAQVPESEPACNKAEGFRDILEKGWDACWDGAAAVLARDQLDRPKKARRTAMNRALLGAGAGCVAALVVGKKLHAGIGWLFVALNMMHLYQHRKVL